MPIRWLYEATTGHLEFQAWGELTMDEVLEAGREFAEKKSGPVHTLLADYSDVTGTDARAEDVHRLLEQDRRMAGVWGGARCAFIAEVDHVYGLGRMYAEISSGNPAELRAFRTRAEGEAWLRRGDEDSAAG